MAEPAAPSAAPPTIERVAADGSQRHFPCKQCGGDLVFPPGATSLACPFCGGIEEIPLTPAAIREYALSDFVPSTKPTVGAGSGPFKDMECTGCGSRLEVPRETAVRPCPYCSGTLVARNEGEELIRPEAILPFIVKRDAAERAVRKWVESLWFAPNDLRRAVTFERFSSLYLPWWTFDSHTLTHYEGEAGYHYTVTVGSGDKRRTETRTRWEWRSGIVERFFDDLPVPGGTFREWGDSYQVQGVKPFEIAYIAGHSAAHYTRGPQEAWPDAKQRMDTAIASQCRGLIGGNTQRNVSISTAHRGVTYKLVLMPRWQGGFRYRGKNFQIVVNGQTGIVRGDRPWSWVKITCAVLAVSAVIVGLIIAFHR